MASDARAVLPMPPGPQRVMIWVGWRAPIRASSSSSRPINGFGRGGLCSGTKVLSFLVFGISFWIACVIFQARLSGELKSARILSLFTRSRNDFCLSRLSSNSINLAGIEKSSGATNISLGILLPTAVLYSFSVYDISLPFGQLPYKCPTIPTNRSHSATLAVQNSSASRSRAPKSSILIQ